MEKILREKSFTLPLNLAEREKIFTEILDEVLGLGPLEPLLKDPTVSDILVNTYRTVYVEHDSANWKLQIHASKMKRI